MKQIFVVVAALVFPAIVPAQTVTRCGNQTGITIDVVSSSDSVAPARLLSLQHAVDTTWVFQVARRSWPLGHIEASIKADWANPAGTSRVCSGVNLSMDQAVVTVKGARGTVHFKASLAELNGSR
jgi:hypothetical protein